MTPGAELPILFAFLAAFCFALAAHIQNLGSSATNSSQAILIIVMTTAALHWLAAPFVVSPTYWLTTATLLFAITGLIRPTLSITLWVEGIKRLGPTLNAGFSASGPVFSATFAILLIGEPLTLQIALGTLFVICGILISGIRPKGIAHEWPLWAMFLPLGAAASRALSHAITKIGFSEVPSPVFVGLVASTVALMVLGTRFVMAGKKFDCERREYLCFIGSGLVTTGGIFSLNVALQAGHIIVVAPIVASSPVFALVLAILVFRKESPTWRTFATVALVVSGVILVILGSNSG
ncbi:MAG: DMT family transporter [Hyphomicrobiaceae bacterium]